MPKISDEVRERRAVMTAFTEAERKLARAAAAVGRMNAAVTKAKANLANAEQDYEAAKARVEDCQTQVAAARVKVAETVGLNGVTMPQGFNITDLTDVAAAEPDEDHVED